MGRLAILLLFVLCLCRSVQAQQSDSDTLRVAEVQYVGRKPFIRRVVDYFDRSTVDRTFEKRMDFTFVGGPAYSSATSLCLGVLAAGLYRTDRTDTELSPSNITLFGKVSITGYYYAGIEGNTFFRGDRHRLDYRLAFQSQPTSFWGIGYDAAMANRRGSYTSKRYTVNAAYKYAVVKDFYAGAVVDFNYTAARKLTVPEYIGTQRDRYMAAGAGLFAEYDSRDVVTQPFSGWYANVTGIVYPKGTGNCGRTLWRVEFTLDWYRRVWEGGVLAADLHGEFCSRGTPWTMNAVLGDNGRMRGYYEGRFNDLDMITAQLELRQRIWRRIGCTVWGGAGNVFATPADFRWSHTLPNWGVGLRWELKQRINIRLDYGFGKKIAGRLVNGFIMSLNEAF